MIPIYVLFAPSYFVWIPMKKSPNNTKEIKKVVLRLNIYEYPHNSQNNIKDVHTPYTLFYSSVNNLERVGARWSPTAEH